MIEAGIAIIFALFGITFMLKNVNKYLDRRKERKEKS